jgi:hypothetical protein
MLVVGLNPIQLQIYFYAKISQKRRTNYASSMAIGKGFRQRNH